MTSSLERLRSWAVGYLRLVEDVEELDAVTRDLHPRLVVDREVAERVRCGGRCNERETEDGEQAGPS